MSFSDLFETQEEEAARLARAPKGSTYHKLSTLPVNITGHLGDKLIELPSEAQDGYVIVVVPHEYAKPPVNDDPAPARGPFRRNTGHWYCIVVASNHPSYPVGGHRLSISEVELCRGRLRGDDLLPKGKSSLTVIDEETHPSVFDQLDQALADIVAKADSQASEIIEEMSTFSPKSSVSRWELRRIWLPKVMEDLDALEGEGE